MKEQGVWSRRYNKLATQHRRGSVVSSTASTDISDHGPGVPTESLAKLFDAFYRPDEARTPGKGGAGLGLAIVKHCVEASGGTVSAANRVPHGLMLKMELTQAN